MGDSKKTITVIDKVKRNGVIIGYNMVDSHNRHKFLLRAAALKYSDNVINAYVKEGYYCTKPGYRHIETVIDEQSEKKSIEDKKSAKVANSKQSVREFKECKGRDFKDICERIRGYAREGNMRIQGKHKSNKGRNIDLFVILKACGYDVFNAVREYLSVLQPYNIGYYKGDNAKEKVGWLYLVEFGYDADLLIKVDETEDVPLVISFHESNDDAIKQRTDNLRAQGDDLCAVITESAVYKDKKDKKYEVVIYLMHGMIKKKIIYTTKHYKDGLSLLNYKSIEAVFNSYINETFNSLLAESLDILSDNEEDGIKALMKGRKSKYYNYSFSAFGEYFCNSICSLLDLYYLEASSSERRKIFIVADRLIELSGIEDKQAILDVLDHSYYETNQAKDDIDKKTLYYYIVSKCEKALGIKHRRQVK